MLSGLIITLRETLEAALVVGIILAFLRKTDGFKYSKHVWYGVVLGIVLSGILAFIFQKYLGGFEGRNEEIYEGVMMFIAAGLLTWMIFWMMFQRSKIKKNLEDRAQMHMQQSNPWGLTLLTFVSVAREGIETVIFMQAAVLKEDGQQVFWGGALGILIAILFSYFMFKGILKISLRKFFTVTSVLLILFAAGLVAHGVHEFEEAGVLPVYIEHLWDTNNIVNEKGVLGEFLKGLFGYNGNPSLLEVLSYGAYLVLIAGSWVLIEKRAAKSP